MAGPHTVREYCRHLLESGDLASKLAPPLAPGGAALDDRSPGPALYIDRPARDAGLCMRGSAERLPGPNQLADPSARATCLRRFAHHELMAVELFAWALLLWPEVPRSLRRAWLRTLHDEQRHLGLYLGRLHELGSDLSDEPLSDYFWKHAASIHAGARGPLGFLSAMGLTLEQANLDFTLLYRDAFRRAGDEESARVSQRVHDDELGHVKLAARWLERLKRPDESDVEAYEASVPFPLGAARAKGRLFSVSARKRAGLSDAMIEYVRHARPGGSGGTRRASSGAPVLFPNLGAEEGDGWRRAYPLPKVREMAAWWGTLFSRESTCIGVSDAASRSLPPELEEDADRAAFSFFESEGSLVPWLSTNEAAKLAEAEGLELAAARPEVVQQVHDKAFALRVAEREGLVPAELEGAIQIIEPELLRRPEQALQHIGRIGKGFVLKPRLGSSGRGRLRADAAVTRRALDRLAARGGCVIEPWLERTEDLSAQLWIARSGKFRILGTLRQELTPSGVWSAHAGLVDATGAVSSSSEHDEGLRRAAARMAAAAAEAGFYGICGLDAFVFRSSGGAEVLRPVVEFNARFTVGTISIGLVDRALRCGMVRPPARFRFSGKHGLEISDL